MINFRTITCGVLGLILIIFSHIPAYADVSLVTSGISAIVGNDISTAEKNAFDDAFFKAYLETALKQVSGSSSIDLTQKLRGFVSSRGNQDIIQFKVISRSQQGNILFLDVDIRLNDAPLRDWLLSQALTTPLGLRPKIILMISTRGPVQNEKNEWWNAQNKGYSLFETQLTQRLRNAGENVSDTVRPPAPSPGADRIFQTASAAGADFVIAGSVTYKYADASTLDARLDLSLIEVKTKQKLSSYNIALKGSVDQKTMNDLLTTAFIDQFRSGIAKKVAVVNQVIREKSLCIEGIRDYKTYQSIIEALASMNALTRITISDIHNHAICHTVQIKGNLQDLLDSLKQKQIVQADMLVDNNSASIRLINP